MEIKSLKKTMNISKVPPESSCDNKLCLYIPYHSEIENSIIKLIWNNKTPREANNPETNEQF